MEKIDTDYRQRISKEWGLTFKPFYRVVAPLTPQRRHASELAGFAALFQWSQRRALLPCIHSTQLSDWIESLNRFREQCSLENLELNCLKFHNCQQQVMDIIFPRFDSSFISPGDDTANCFDKWRRQNLAMPLKHGTEWSCYSLPTFFVRLSLHHPYPRVFWTLPSFAPIKRPRWRPIELNERHLRFHGKIGDCGQSKSEDRFLFFSCG